MSYVVKDYMDKEFPTIEVTASVVEAARVVSTNNKGYSIVLEKGAPKGIVTEWDLVSKVLAAEKNPRGTAVSAVMSSPLITVDPDEDLIKASEIMQKKEVKRLAVIKSGIIYGVVTSTDIAMHCGDYVNKSIRDIMRWSIPFA